MVDNYKFIDDFVAGSAYPYDIEDMKQFEKDGIVRIFSLTPKLPLVSRYYEGDTISFEHLPIYSTPDQEQIQRFISILKDDIRENHKVVIHCQYGQERTGIFLAAYLIKIKNMKPKEAIKFIQENRPGSLQTHHAQEFVKKNI